MFCIFLFYILLLFHILKTIHSFLEFRYSSKILIRVEELRDERELGVTFLRGKLASDEGERERERGQGNRGVSVEEDFLLNWFTAHVTLF